MEAQDKRISILKAASACFSRYGYEKTTLDDIGKLVGLNKASLYYYYKNKESIYTEVIYYEANDFLAAVFEEVHKVQGCSEKITAYLSQRLRYVRSAVNLSQLSIDSRQQLAPLFGEMYARITEKEANMLAEVLAACMKNGELAPCDAKKVADGILTVSLAVLNSHGACNPDMDAAACKEGLDEATFIVELILKGLKAEKQV